jgi:hypothetical protein
MTVEELLQPRYEVIADYPGNVQRIGYIFQVIGDEQSIEAWCSEKNKYPHLFKKLAWFEKREVSEMPGYVILTHPKLRQDKVYDDFMKVSEWRKYEDGFSAVVGECLIGAGYVHPATESDFLEYQKNKNV